MQSYRFPTEIQALFPGFSCDTHKPKLLFIKDIKIKNRIQSSLLENRKPKQLVVNCLGKINRVKTQTNKAISLIIKSFPYSFVGF